MTTTSRVRFQSGGLSLEGALFMPDGPPPAALVVVCHPHPQNGGEMSNNVVLAAVRGLLDMGIGALTFNFRGVGGSEGAYDNGLGEQDDVRAAMTYARAIDGVSTTGLAGYSFGARMAAAVADESVTALALISAPTRDPALYERLSGFEGAVMFISGTADPVSRVETLSVTIQTFRTPPRVVPVPGADHFWWGREDEVASNVGNFFSATLLSAGD